MGNESSVRDYERAGDSELDLAGVWSALAKKKKLIFGVTVASVLAAIGFLAITPARYTGEVKLIVENQESYFTRPDKATADSANTIDSEAIASQVQLITSREIGREAINRLALKGNAEFDRLAGGEGIVSRLLGLAGISRSRPQMSTDDRILTEYSEKLTVFSVPKSRVISIEFHSRDPELAARGANAIADIYMEQQSKAKKEQASLAASSIGAVVADLRTRLAEAESKVEAFRSNAGLFQGSTATSITNQQLGDLSTQLAAARNTMADAQAKARLIRASLQRGRLDEISDVANDDLVRRVAEQRATLRGRLALEARTLGPSHPRMQELNAQLASTESELRSAAERRAKGLENDARIASARVENILSAIESEKRRVGGTGNDQAQLRELELEAKLIREQLESNTTKYREALARQQSASTPSDARIISRALVPEKPTFPKTIPILAFALIGGLMLSTAGVVSAELLSGRAMHPGRIPPAPAPLDGGPDGVRVGPRLSARSRAREALGVGAPAGLGAAARLAQRCLLADTHTYAMRILACDLAGGRDAVDDFARTLAEGKRAILVDFTGEILPGAPGLCELVQGEAGFADVIEREGASRLHLLGRGSGIVEVSEDLDAVIDALSQTYDFVIMLAGAYEGQGASALQLAPAADKAVLVADARVQAPQISALRDGLAAEGVREIVVFGETSAVAANDIEAPAHAA